MMGCPLSWKCIRACRCGEESQQPTCPQVKHRRKCTHFEPILRQSSQPSALGDTSRIIFRCGSTISSHPFPSNVQRIDWHRRRALPRTYAMRSLSVIGSSQICSLCSPMILTSSDKPENVIRHCQIGQDKAIFGCRPHKGDYPGRVWVPGCASRSGALPGNPAFIRDFAPLVWRQRILDRVSVGGPRPTMMSTTSMP